MSLNNSQVKAAKPKVKLYKLYDRDNLFLLVRPNGTKTWKYGFRLGGKQNTYHIGSYPEVTLAEAREEAVRARKLVNQGINPTKEKQNQLNQQQTASKRFSAYCEEWLDKQTLQPTTEKDLRQRLKKNIYPYLDKANVADFTTRDIYDVLIKMTDRGNRENALRMAGIIRRVYNELFLLDVVNTNPAQGITELLPRPNKRSKQNFAHITSEVDLKALLQAIQGSSNRFSPSVILALKLMPLVFLRPKNIRYLKWEQIDFNNSAIIFDKGEMKTVKEFTVPLSTQAIHLLNQAKAIKHPTSPYVFTTARSNGKPMSENTTTYAIRRLINPNTGKPFGTGYMTSHGFRHTASTFLNEKGYHPDVIELQLAHENRDRVRATYNKAEWMSKRRSMMQEWSDYLESLLEND